MKRTELESKAFTFVRLDMTHIELSDEEIKEIIKNTSDEDLEFFINGIMED